MSTRSAQQKTSPNAEYSILDDIIAETRLTPDDEAFGIAKRGVAAFIEELLKPQNKNEPVKKAMVDRMIAEIDAKLSLQMDEILHHADFQSLESAWRGLQLLVDRTNFRENIKIEVLNVSKDDLLEDFEDSPEVMQSGLYKHIYTAEYGQFGGEPVGAIIANYFMSPSSPDVKLMQYVSSVACTIVVVPLDASGRALAGEGAGALTFTLAPDRMQPVGFAEDEALIPYPLNTFRGYRYLQEYFAFQDKFLFVDLTGLDVLKSLPEATLKQVCGLELRFDIRKSSGQRLRPTLDNVKLFCTPVVNLFEHDATPIRLDGKQDEYLVMPSRLGTHNCGVFSVDSVNGWRVGGAGQQAYVPFESFEHDPSFDVPSNQAHYSVRQRLSMLHDGLDTYLSFGIRHEHDSETLSVELTCTNQNLPRQLNKGDICLPTEGTPEGLVFRNITAVTSSYAPPLTRDFLWKLISNMSLNYLSLANVDALKVILETYDLPRYYDEHAARVSKCLLDGLKSIRHEHVDRLHRGLPLRGVLTELTIDPQGYVGEGDVFVFASVLNEFFALYASLNSYHQLRVNSTQGEVYQWTPRMGLQPLL